MGVMHMNPRHGTGLPGKCRKEGKNPMPGTMTLKCSVGKKPVAPNGDGQLHRHVNGKRQ
jgi:hypothetical protein